MQNNFDKAFQRLVASWHRHERLRAEQAPFADRLDASSQLLDARVEMARARRFL